MLCLARSKQSIVQYQLLLLPWRRNQNPMHGRVSAFLAQDDHYQHAGELAGFWQPRVEVPIVRELRAIAKEHVVYLALLRRVDFVVNDVRAFVDEGHVRGSPMRKMLFGADLK